MDEEIALELASQKVIQFLLANQKFQEKWQEETRKNLEKQKNKKQRYEDDEGIDLRKPSTSTTSTSSANKPPDPSVITLQEAVQELTSTIQCVIYNFEENVNPLHCILEDDGPRRKIGNPIYDVGQKVEKLKYLEMDKRELRERNGKQIGSACRRVALELKRFGKQFQNTDKSLPILHLLPLINRFCRLFYTLSHEISRFSDGFRSKNRNLLKKIGSTVEESANEFNLEVAAEIENRIASLKSAVKNPRPPRPSSAPKSAAHTPEYGTWTGHQQRLAASVQQVIAAKQPPLSEGGNRKFQRTHPPGSIATSIIPLRRGYLMEDNLMKARQRIAAKRVKPRDMNTLNIDKASPLVETTDEILMKSARKLTGLVLDDVRKSIRF